MSEKNKSSFSDRLGFVMAAAGSAVGLGNIWRFPYLAAKDGGGIFIFCYIILAATFGFTLLTTEVAIGRKTGKSPLTAYGQLHKKWGGIGIITTLVPIMILPYYCAIGGWILKYFEIYLTGQTQLAATDKYFSEYISSNFQPEIFMIIFLVISAAIVFLGVDKGIERLGKILMPILLVIITAISIYSITIRRPDINGVVRTGIDGLKMYVIPNFTGLTLKKFVIIMIDAMGQLFFSISVATGIMVTYGSYVKKDVNLMKSINQVEIFDTIVAILAGLMIVPAVYVFMGTDGMSAGPGLMFVSLPKIFYSMGKIGTLFGAIFFLMVIFAAITSAVSVIETIVSNLIDKFNFSRTNSCIIVSLYGLIGGIIMCLGYQQLYFEFKLPNGVTGQILDIFDYVSNNCLMPLVALLTCILIGWVVGPKAIIDEVCLGGYKFSRQKLYIIMVKFIAPAMLFFVLLQSIGIMKL